MAVEQDTASVAKMLRQRQKEMLAQRDDHLKQINQLSDELQRLFAKAPKKPRGGSVKELDDQINALEFKRTTSSLALAQEKEILREIDSLKRAKMQVEERKKHEETIQEKKAELSALRDSLSLILASIDELNPVLAKVELADRLECATTELTTITIQCPKEKTRHVIGKNGANIKQIMERTNVAIDVGSDDGKIEITGSQGAIEAATKEIRRITEAVEENVQVSPVVVEYLTSRHLNAFAEFREQHSDVFVDVSRNSTKVRLQGLTEDVSDAKDALLAMNIKQQSRSLTSVETSVVVGKKGVNINKLTDEHKVAIEVKKNEEVTVSVIGSESNVAAAMAAIDELLELNKDVTESVPIDNMIRNILLNNGGTNIKKLQKDVNDKVPDGDGMVMLTVDKTTRGDDSSILLRGRRPALLVASEAVDEAIKEHMDAVVKMKVDAYIAPRLIGKGGANIKKMKSQGDGVLIDVDDVGNVQLYGSKEDVDAVVKQIQAVVEENHLERLDCDPSNAKPMFRYLIREKNKEINSTISGCDLDEKNSQIVLRGTEEQIKIVSDLIREFMANNFIEEVAYDKEDEDALLMGGSGSVVSKMADELGITMIALRVEHVIVCRGNKEKVSEAKKKLEQFLRGGDGYSITKIVVSEQAVGAVIGKGGSRRMELEEKHGGLKIFIDRTSGLITVRGKEQNVLDCRTEILKIVSSIRIQETMSLTSQQHAELSKPDVVRRLTAGIPVHVTVTETEVSVRGMFADARDALALLKAHLTGVYETHVELDSAQYAKISSSCRDPSHFNRMKESTSTEIELSPSSSSIVIRGKRGNVKKAKLLLMGFLDFLLPSNFEHIKTPKVFQSTVASAASLADVAAVSGASVVLDRDLNSIQVMSSDPGKVKEATELINSKMAEAEKLVFLLQIDQNESWLIPALIGKGGKNVNAMRKETGCRIDVSKQELSVTISGEDEESVAKAKSVLAAAMDKARRECVIVQLPSKAVPAFIGKSGANVRKFTEEHKVEVESGRKDQTKLMITGQEDAVAAAKSALLEWINTWEASNAETSISVEKSMIPAIVGKDGSVVNAIQKESGCRVDIDRSSSMITLRGGTLESRNAAMQKISSIVADEEALKLEREQKKKERDAAERAERNKNEKPSAAAPSAQPMEDLDSRKDRSAEFSARPVGLTTGGKSSKNTSSNKKLGEDAPLVGTAAGRHLFSLLVSDSIISTADDSRDASTRSSSLVSTSQGTESTNGTGNSDPAEGPVYVKSASGFAVRV